MSTNCYNIQKNTNMILLSLFSTQQSCSRYKNIKMSCKDTRVHVCVCGRCVLGVSTWVLLEREREGKTKRDDKNRLAAIKIPSPFHNTSANTQHCCRHD